MPLDKAIAVAGGGEAGRELVNRLAGDRARDSGWTEGPLRLITISEEFDKNTTLQGRGRWVDLIHETLIRSKGLDWHGYPQPYWSTLWDYIEQHKFYSCFISFSSKDEAFAKQLYSSLESRGIRCWFAPHDLPIGAKWDAIDEAVQLLDKLLVILSDNSLASDWVEDEVSKAFAEERRRGKIVLFPIRLDDAVIKTDEPWAVKLRDQRNIGDFSPGRKATLTRKASTVS